MLTTALQVMKYVRTSARRSNINVVFEDINQPRHDGKTIYLPRITLRTSERELKTLMASTDHEVAHDLYSSFKVLEDAKLPPNSLMMYAWNLLEDARVNHIEATNYIGFRENWDETSSLLVTSIVDKFNSSPKESLVPKVLSAMLRWDATVAQDLFPLVHLATEPLVVDKKISDTLTRFTPRLVSVKEILDKTAGTTATYELAHDILKELGDECREELEKALAEADKAKKDQPEGTGKGKSSSTKKAEKAEGEDPASEEESDSSDDLKIVKVELTEEQMDTAMTRPRTGGGDMTKTGINFDYVPSKGTWDVTDPDKFVVVDYIRNTGRSDMRKKSPYNSFVAQYNTHIRPKLMTNENFAQQVRRLIQIRARVQTQYGVKKGKLDSSRLSRICFDAPGFNERVFKNKIDNKMLDAAVTVLVDMSGSMGGHKVLNAAASAVLMNEVCSVLGIPLEILGFSDTHADGGGEPVPSMFVYKSFADLKITEEQLLKGFEASSEHMSGNPDGENIIWANDRLLQRKERRRLMIVMSDGCPAASKSGSAIGPFTKKVIQEIERSGKTEIYGLGLLSTSVKDYYKSNSVVNTPEEIPHRLLELIEQRILKV